MTSSPNHWANEITTKDYIEKILNPYLIHKRAKLNLASNQHALCIFDNFKGQLTDEVLKLLEDSHIDIVFVPPNCTDMLQPLDLSVNKSAKDYLKSRFQQWYSDQIFQQQNDTSLQPVKFPMQVMRPLGAQWIFDFFYYMQSNPDIVRNGFRVAGITEVCNIE